MADFDQENAEAYPSIPEEDEDVQKTKLMEFTPAEIKALRKNEQISRDNVHMYVAQQDRLQNGSRHMKAKNVKYLRSKRMLTREQVEDYISYQRSPMWYNIKDVAKAPANGVRNFVQGLWDMARSVPTVNPLAPFQGEMTPDFMKDDDYEPMIPAYPDLPEVFSPSKTVAGRIIEGATEFLVPFGASSKMLKAAKYAPRVMAKLPRIAAKFPRSAKFIEFTLADTTAGALADASIDPYSGRATDMMAEWGILPEFLEWMKTNPDNPEAIERFKSVLEGAGLGFSLDAVLFGARMFKAGVWDRHMSDVWKISDEINAKYGLDMEIKGAELPENVPGAESVFARKRRESDARIKAFDDVMKHQEMGFDESTRRLKMVDEAGKVIDDPDFAPTRKITEAMEKVGGDGAALIEYLYRNATDLMDKARGGKLKKQPAGHMARRSRAVTQRKSDAFLKKELADRKTLAKDIGGGHVNAFTKKIAAKMKQYAQKVEDMDVYVRAFNQTFAQYGDEVTQMVREALDPSVGTPAMRMKAAEHIKVLEEMQASVFGIRANIGRTQGIYNEPWVRTRFDFDKMAPETLKHIDDMRGNEIDKLLRQFNRAGSTRQKLKLARYTGRNKWLQGMVELVQANLLWNPATHAVNIVGNASALALEGAIRHFAVTGDAIFSRDLARLTELKGFWTGMGTALGDSFKIEGLPKFAKERSIKSLKELEFGKVWKALASGEAQLDAMVKLEGQLGGGMDAIINSMPAVPKFLLMPMVKIAQLPFHSLTAGDELFKNLGYRSEVNSLLYRKAIRDGLNTVETRAFVDKWKDNVPSEIHYAALNRARELTFQQDLGRGTAAKGLAQALNSDVGTLAQVSAVPFFKIAVNLTKFTYGRSPFAFISKKFAADIAAGGVQRWEAIGRQATGMALMGAGLVAYDQGVITGRIPEGQREAWQNAGKLPYAIKWRGKYYSYDRLDPFGMTLGFFADVGQLWDIAKYNTAMPEHKRIEFLSAALATLYEPVVNKTWMKGMADVMAYVTGQSHMPADKFWMKQSEKFIPGHTGFEWYHKTFTHNNIPDMNEWSDVFQKKWAPTEGQHIRHSVYGTKVEREPDAALIFRTGKVSDPVAAEMVNIQMSVKKPQKELYLGRDMTPEQYAEYNDILASMPIQQKLWEMIQDPRYQAIQDNATRKKHLMRVIKVHRKAAKQMLGQRDPDVLKNYRLDYQQQRDNIMKSTTENEAAKRLYHRLKIKE